jgi:immunoglobulin-binding protein 1
MDLIASLLPVARPGHAVADSDDEEEDGDSETADLLRKSALMLLRLMYTRARSRLESAKQETALLQSMPPPPPSRPEDDPRDAARKADGNLWRLDQPVSTGGPDGRGPLMDASGKVGQP